MLSLLQKILGILKKEMHVNKDYSYDYEFYLISEMLKSSANSPEVMVPFILRLKIDICKKLSKEAYPDFHKKLDAIISDIIAYDKSFLVENF